MQGADTPHLTVQAELAELLSTLMDLQQQFPDFRAASLTIAPSVQPASVSNHTTSCQQGRSHSGSKKPSGQTDNKACGSMGSTEAWQQHTQQLAAKLQALLALLVSAYGATLCATDTALLRLMYSINDYKWWQQHQSPSSEIPEISQQQENQQQQQAEPVHHDDRSMADASGDVKEDVEMTEATKAGMYGETDGLVARRLGGVLSHARYVGQSTLCLVCARA